MLCTSDLSCYLNQAWENTPTVTVLEKLKHNFYSVQDNLPKGGTAHCELGPPISIINQKLSIVESDGDIFINLPKWF